MTPSFPNSSIILLAAGAAHRMGRPKQLLDWAGEPLIVHMTKRARSAGAGEVLVVTGAYAKQIAPLLADLSVRSVHNPDWKNGMGTSLAAATRALSANSERALVLLADQPSVTSSMIEAYLNQSVAEPRQIISTHYDYCLGVPAVFPRALFPELSKLNADRGARDLLNDPAAAHESFVFKHLRPLWDLDTPADYDRHRPAPKP